MNKFIKYLFSFGLFFLGLLSLLFFAYLKIHHLEVKSLPPPNLTNSFSMNDKLDFARGKRADVIAIGSSMSLNNLDSKIITKECNTTSYLNLSSWGMSMSDIYFTLRAYASLHQPITLIISSNIGDFTVVNKALDESLLSSFLNASSATYSFYYLHHFNLKYFTENFAYLKKVKQDSTSYEYLRYDDFGAVLFKSGYLKISPSRWNAPIGQDPAQSQYEYLAKIASFCKENQIELLFFQSPVRAGMFSDSKNPVDKMKIVKHVNRVEAILKSNGFPLADASATEWSDSLFADNLHFFDFGAKQYTSFCFKKVIR